LTSELQKGAWTHIEDLGKQKEVQEVQGMFVVAEKGTKSNKIIG